jgi:2-dehydro-3-deoxy-D-gluconate 5-dehydrogenase
VTDNPFDLDGEVALVTGGNGGIGRAMALALARAGADIAIVARDPARSAAVRREVEALGRRAAAFTCDVSSSSDVDRAVNGALAALGKLSIVVNNAGISRAAPPETLSEADWDAVLDVNLKGSFLVARACFPALVANGRGKIINVGSGYSFFGTTANLPYGASKGGVLTLTYGLANSWAQHGIQVNAVIPGVIETDIWSGAFGNDIFRKRIEQRTPAGRVGQPEDVGGVTVFLASRASDFVTGQWIAVDGGYFIADSVFR